MSFSLIQKTRDFPVLPYEKIKNVILGKTYTLTLVSVGEKRAQELNKSYRNATYVPNVLSFPLTEDTGEIYISPRKAKTEHKKFNMTYTGYIGFLYIHGLLHLKGHAHGDTMEKLEHLYTKRFGLK